MPQVPGGTIKNEVICLPFSEDRECRRVWVQGFLHHIGKSTDIQQIFVFQNGPSLSIFLTFVIVKARDRGQRSGAIGLNRNSERIPRCLRRG